MGDGETLVLQLASYELRKARFKRVFGLIMHLAKSYSLSLFVGWFSLVPLRIRTPYKLFGFELRVRAWKKADHTDLGVVEFPFEATISLDKVQHTPTNNIFTQLGDLGVGCPKNIFFPLSPDNL